MTPPATTTALAIKVKHILKYAIAVEIAIIAVIYGMSGATNTNPIQMFFFLMLWPLAWRISEMRIEEVAE